MPATSDVEVLVVGAGPTGLSLALWLARSGVRPRVVAASPGPATASRAMGVQARTLEFYDQLGIAGDVVEAGIPLHGLTVRTNGEAVARVELGRMGEGLSPYPLLLVYPQDEHERYLLDRLRDLDVAVEWGTELVGLEDRGDHVRARLRDGERTSNAEAAWVCGCDGARSAVREGLGIGFSGETYEQVFYVADVAVREGEVEGHAGASFEGETFALLFPIRDGAHARLIGVLPPDLSGRDTVTFADLRPTVERLTGVAVGDARWFSTYRVHHRVADRFEAGRAFLAGDAGHVHSPAGGQGMNTGIGDAVNLGWKLAAVVRGTANASLLGTYEPERIGFARTLVSTTDRLFSYTVGRGPIGRAVRDVALPHVLARAMRFAAVRRALFRRMSQIGIRYPDSPLSEGEAGDVRGGDRLPWVAGADNFAPLASLGWQAHVYGDAAPPIRETAAALGLPLHTFGWDGGAGRAGLRRDAVYVVRPDGHVGLADPAPTPGRLRAYALRAGIAKSGAGGHASGLAGHGPDQA